MVFGDPPSAPLFHQNLQQLEPQDPVRPYWQTSGHLGESGHFPGHIYDGYIRANEAELSNRGFHRSALKDRLSDFDVALLEFFTSVADCTKDVCEATVLGKMVGRVAVNDCIDSLCILCGRIVSWR